MKTINTKSFLIGLLFGVCAFLALGAASGKQEDVGRYQIVCPYTNSRGITESCGWTDYESGVSLIVLIHYYFKVKDTPHEAGYNRTPQFVNWLPGYSDGYSPAGSSGDAG
jgi:hypothetical protein